MTTPSEYAAAFREAANKSKSKLTFCDPMVLSLAEVFIEVAQVFQSIAEKEKTDAVEEMKKVRIQRKLDLMSLGKREEKRDGN